MQPAGAQDRTDRRKRLTDIRRVRNRFFFKDYSAVSIDNADAGHFKRDIKAREQYFSRGRSPGHGTTGKETTGDPED
ncbi:hypothetical protein LNKW23_37800 [Paralimibaculum aggregatum]|uniref:Uncharacterized protein n=1 Tax=Paralimibaculum aggregatum TaxID=3036245 RepID=A0ABQ6LPT9_9RHOB|nr:hypothetical protein LNKW23_37800 [Limibaculum sp. NKW23]